MRLSAAIGTTIMMVGLARPAFADAVPPVDEDADCPTGSEPSTCHGGDYCSIRECETDADCRDGTTCQAQSFCVGTINCSGMDPEPSNTRDVAECDTNACGSCESLLVCADSGCGCEVVGAPRSAARGSLAGLLVALLWLRRRRS